MDETTLVRAAFDAYRTGDLEAALPLYGRDLTFTSPPDDHIGPAAFFERCFPTAGRFARQDLRHVVALGGGEVVGAVG